MRSDRGWGIRCALAAAALTGALWVAGALAAATIADVDGDVRLLQTGADSPRGVAPGERIGTGSLLTTAAGARVVLRFDDGMWAALGEHSRFRIEAYRYRPEEPPADRSALVLLRGVLRVVTGILGHRTPDAFELRTPELVVGVRGTDFMVSAGDAVYLAVLEGTVTATNARGVALFSAGQYAAGVGGHAPAAIPTDALPPAVASAFGHLGALPLAPETGSGRYGPGQAPGRGIGPGARELKGAPGKDLGGRAPNAPGQDIAPNRRPR